MTTQQFISKNTAFLAGCGIETARLDCLIILEDGLNTNRTHLLAYPDQKIPEKTLNVITKNIQRRSLHVPLAYIRGHVEFYGLTFNVDKHVLVPRPESESMINILQRHQLPHGMVIIDIGTGSGALAITAKHLLPKAQVIATDIDPACLAIAKQNAELHQADVAFIEGSLAETLPADIYDRPLVFLCNLPYIPTSYPINSDATHEPQLALFAGSDGLDLYRKLFAILSHKPVNQCSIITESLQFQHSALSALAKTAGFTLADTEGLAQCFMKTVRRTSYTTAPSLQAQSQG